MRPLVEPNLAAVLILPTNATAAQSVVLGANGVDTDNTGTLLAWAGDLRQTALLEVPVPLRRTLMCFRALYVPIATPVLHLGGLLVPAAAKIDPLIQAVERPACDFALRLEQVQREQLLASLAQLEDSDDAPVSSAPVFHCYLDEFEPASRRSA